MKISGSSNTAANAVIPMGQAFQRPLETTTIELPPGRAAPPEPIVATSHFNVILIIVVGFTATAFIADIVMASFYSAAPTAMQQSAFDGMGYVWKMGFGAIVGLLGGKTVA